MKTKKEPTGSSRGSAIKDSFQKVRVLDEAFGVNINLDHAGYLRHLALRSFQGLEREIEPETHRDSADERLLISREKAGMQA
jgi:hypothetical protein